jgi:hypothetical protein
MLTLKPSVIVLASYLILSITSISPVVANANTSPSRCRSVVPYGYIVGLWKDSGPIVGTFLPLLVKETSYFWCDTGVVLWGSHIGYRRQLTTRWLGQQWWVGAYAGYDVMSELQGYLENLKQLRWAPFLDYPTRWTGGIEVNASRWGQLIVNCYGEPYSPQPSPVAKDHIGISGKYSLKNPLSFLRVPRLHFFIGGAVSWVGLYSDNYKVKRLPSIILGAKWLVNSWLELEVKYIYDHYGHQFPVNIGFQLKWGADNRAPRALFDHRPSSYIPHYAYARQLHTAEYRRLFKIQPYFELLRQAVPQSYATFSPVASSETLYHAISYLPELTSNMPINKSMAIDIINTYIRHCLTPQTIFESKKEGATLLHCAALYNQPLILKGLLEQLPVEAFNHSETQNKESILFINSQDPRGDTALLIAARHGNAGEDIMRQLLRYGADPDIPNNNDELPLHLAAKNFLSYDTYRLLHRASDFQKAALWYNVLANRLESSVRSFKPFDYTQISLNELQPESYLIHPTLSEIDSKGNTIIHLLAEGDMDKAFETLQVLSQGPSYRALLESYCNIPNEAGKIPLQIALATCPHNNEIIRILYEHTTPEVRAEVNCWGDLETAQNPSGHIIVLQFFE